MAIASRRLTALTASRQPAAGYLVPRLQFLHRRNLVLSSLEARSLNYIFAARAYANLKNEIYGMKDWVEVCPGIAVKEWRHQPADPKTKARRHIVVRKQISTRPQAGGKLLFEDLLDYRFSLYVTNLDLPLDQIWDINNSRADCEPSAARSTA